uniref:Fibrinogen C-terminal domain-containing protein n=1 Tax=Biomphalaria glabrata TaxID=6526 RepID=A0A2C9LY85_BIOGL
MRTKHLNRKLQVSCKCLPKPTSCRDVVSSEDRVVVTLASGLEVMCDTKTAGGGWIIFQRRFDGSVNFYRAWKEYRDGFGDYNIGEFYLGNRNIFDLTSKRRHELRVDLEFKGNKYFAQYSTFQLSNENDNYRLHVSWFSGNATNGFREQNGLGFSTYDRDNDRNNVSCAIKYHGAWWYNNCHLSNLNGLWGTKEFGKGLEWFNLTGEYDSVSFSEMKIREVV